MHARPPAGRCFARTAHRRTRAQHAVRGLNGAWCTESSAVSFLSRQATTWNTAVSARQLPESTSRVAKHSELPTLRAQQDTASSAVRRERAGVECTACRRALCGRWSTETPWCSSAPHSQGHTCVARPGCWSSGGHSHSHLRVLAKYRTEKANLPVATLIRRHLVTQCPARALRLEERSL